MRLSRSVSDIASLSSAVSGREAAVQRHVQDTLGDIRSLAQRPLTPAERQLALTDPAAGRKKIANWAFLGGLRNLQHSGRAWNHGRRWQAAKYGAAAAAGFAGVAATIDTAILFGASGRIGYEAIRGQAFSRRTEGGYRGDLVVRRLRGIHADVNSLLQAHGTGSRWIDTAGGYLRRLRADIEQHADLRVRESSLIQQALIDAEKALGSALVGQPSRPSMRLPEKAISTVGTGSAG